MRNYKKYLKSKKWKIIKSKILDRDLHRCKICGNTNNLSVQKVMDGESLKYLITLCSSCHKKIEFNKDKKKA